MNHINLSDHKYWLVEFCQGFTSSGFLSCTTFCFWFLRYLKYFVPLQTIRDSHLEIWKLKVPGWCFWKSGFVGEGAPGARTHIGQQLMEEETWGTEGNLEKHTWWFHANVKTRSNTTKSLIGIYIRILCNMWKPVKMQLLVNRFYSFWFGSYGDTVEMLGKWTWVRSMSW